MQVKQRKQTNQVVLSRLLLTEFDFEERTHFVFYSLTIQRETKKYFFIETSVTLLRKKTPLFSHICNIFFGAVWLDYIFTKNFGKGLGQYQGSTHLLT